ncbi:MAG TPA: MBL fold metallo-hydrolase [Fimbriimonadaceae bacterium]|nr:MBL fold metallo-hydrolase [Fimbriimonadaceae bacterium]
MVLRLLGTGAAEGIPAFCAATRVSDYARANGGKDVRTRSGALLDCCIKIDLPPDTLMQMHRDGLDASDWSCLIFTHGHDDHFTPSELQYALYPFNDQEQLGYTIYANPQICARIRTQYPDWPMAIFETNSFRTFEHEGYRITPIHANHKPDEDAQNLIFEKNGKRLLYATDTGYWLDETWSFLEGWKLDALVIECCEGLRPTDYYGHLDVGLCLQMIERLRKMGVLTDDSLICTTHHSHNGDATHAELEAALNPHGVQVGYDGLELRI